MVFNSPSHTPRMRQCSHHLATHGKYPLWKLAHSGGSSWPAGFTSRASASPVSSLARVRVTGNYSLMSGTLPASSHTHFYIFPPLASSPVYLQGTKRAGMLLHAKAREGTEEAGPHSGQTSLVHNSILFSCYTQMWVQTPSYQSAPGGHYQLELRLLETSLLAPDFGPKTNTSLFPTFKLKGVGSLSWRREG